MKKISLKSNKGISMVDVIIAISILVMFAGVIGTLFCQIITESNSVRLNSVAVYYCVKVAEYVDEISYDDVDNNLLDNIENDKNFVIPNGVNIEVDVENYAGENSDKQDIMKVVNIRVEINPNGLEESENFEFKKLKIKEI